MVPSPCIVSVSLCILECKLAGQDSLLPMVPSPCIVSVSLCILECKLCRAGFPSPNGSLSLYCICVPLYIRV
uniref:Uncharacterized protein n=2 Tax=Xenopus tropicalis TaxID=8364 RepID=A0A1B8Y254_XENTR